MDCRYRGCEPLILSCPSCSSTFDCPAVCSSICMSVSEKPSKPEREYNFWRTLRCPKCPEEVEAGRISPGMIANQVIILKIVLHENIVEFETLDLSLNLSIALVLCHSIKPLQSKLSSRIKLLARWCRNISLKDAFPSSTFNVQQNLDILIFDELVILIK